MQAISISAEKLNNQYQENEVAADEKYRDQIVQVTGKVHSVDKMEHIFSGPTYTVNLDADEFGIYQVQCEFSEEHQGDVAKLKKGKKVTIQGTCEGLMIVYAQLGDCKLVK